MNFAWYFEIFAGRQPDPVWRLLIFPWTGWAVVLLVVLLAGIFYYLLTPTKVNRFTWNLFCLACAVLSALTGIFVMRIYPPRVMAASFLVACLVLGPVLFFLVSLAMKTGSHNGRYIPTEKP